MAGFNPDPFGVFAKATSTAKTRGHFDPKFGLMVGLKGQDLTLRNPNAGYKDTGFSMNDETAYRRAQSVRAAADAAAAAAPKSKPKKPASPNPAALADLLGLDAGAMADKEFDPQFALLNQLASQATTRYGKAGKDVSGMYAQLADEFRKQESGIKGQYGAQDKALVSQQNAATGTMAADYAKSRDELASRAARLGVADTVPTLDKESANQQNQTAGLLSAIAANFRGANTMNQGSAVDYNRDTAATTDLMGADARQAFAMKLQQALDEYSNKNLELQGQKGAAENKYGLSIQEQENAQEKARADAEAAKSGQKLKWDIAKLQYAPKAAGEPNYKNMPADVGMATLAQKLYPNVGDSTRSNAVQAILDTVARGDKTGKKKWANVEDFLSSVASRNQGATDYNQLRALGRLYYEKIAGGSDKPYG